MGAGMLQRPSGWEPPPAPPPSRTASAHRPLYRVARPAGSAASSALYCTSTREMKPASSADARSGPYIRRNMRYTLKAWAAVTTGSQRRGGKCQM
eukprot:1182074-Prorocentrum_minimum.AAC.8